MINRWEGKKSHIFQVFWPVDPVDPVDLIFWPIVYMGWSPLNWWCFCWDLRRGNAVGHADGAGLATAKLWDGSACDDIVFPCVSYNDFGPAPQIGKSRERTCKDKSNDNHLHQCQAWWHWQECWFQSGHRNQVTRNVLSQGIKGTVALLSYVLVY